MSRPRLLRCLFLVAALLWIPVLATVGGKPEPPDEPHRRGPTAPVLEELQLELSKLWEDGSVIGHDQRIGTFEPGSEIRWVVPVGPTICLASNPTCEAARKLAAATPCTNPDSCASLQEYRKLWGEPGVRPAPTFVTTQSPAAEITTRPSDRK
ncbi:MAG: hypothetical protein MPN21_24760 [Thermoanaerobaculia bacterium]|nr:hypothetical protein [Thermoanaerobaculia bacterium]